MKLPITRAELHEDIYIFGLTMLVCCLPLSRYFLSISQFILAINWIAEGQFAKKVKILRRQPALFIFISIFLVYLAGMLFTENVDGGLSKLKNVLPLTLLPLIIASSEPLSLKRVTRILFFYIVAVAVAALICLIAYLSNPGASTRDFRKISLFIPHIRFALLIIMAIVILLYGAFIRPVPIAQKERLGLIILAILLTAFLFVLRSFAGIIILFICTSVFMIRATVLNGSRTMRIVTISSVVSIYLLVIFFIGFVYIKNFHAPPINPLSLDIKTANGNEYENNTADKILENGNYVNLYVCEKELRKAWNERSLIPYDSLDMKGQPVYNTLNRYLTSRGLRKDSAGLSRLAQDEIHAVERGRANYLFDARPGPYQRLYETLWEIHIWRNTGFVSYHSFGQRIVFLQNAASIIRNNFWTGVGTGDVYATMMKTIQSHHEDIERRWKGEPHNQFAFLFMAFGIFGFGWIMFSWIFPACKNRSYRYLLFNLFGIIVLISMMVLDTIESYDNMVFFSFFYSLFVFGSGNLKKKPDGLN